jgi:3-oxoacyl-[acyl-carrier protein] reductase
MVPLNPFNELVSLSGRVAVVTGAGRGHSGLGYAIASRLAEAGAALVVTDANAEGVIAAADDLQTAGYSCVAVPGDVREPAAAEKAIEEAVRSFGRLDILVNNAAVWPRAKLDDWTHEEVSRVFDINVYAPLLWCQVAIRRLRAQGQGGSIINIASTAAQMVIDEEHLVYEASKAALVKMTHGIAKAVGGDGIRVNNIIPGSLGGPRNPDGSKRALTFNSSPWQVFGAGRGDPDPVARGVVFLASDLGEWCTGCDWRIDGGRWLGPPSENVRLPGVA